MKRILLVDNDKVTSKLTQKFLTNYGYEVESVELAKNALDLLVSPDFDLILSEIELPGITGFDMVNLLQKCKIDVPVAFLTTKDDVTTQFEALNCGVEQLISKRREYSNLPHILDSMFFRLSNHVA